ncbi:MAG: hypothetical protein NTV52_03025 [Acidobacteria bacterium]|nr:hypothetical protein [Acidobacteriota bacterium]
MDTITITVAENDPDVIVSATLNEDAVTITLNEAATGATGPGVPTGGSDNDILKKTSSTNYATEWETPTSAATASTIVRRDASGGAAFVALTGTGNWSTTGHFFSNPSTAEAGHFITKNGTTPTLAAGRSAWFSNATGDPQFKNGTSSAVTLVYSGGALGTPSSGTLTNCTGLPVSTGISGLGAGVATFLATPSSANLIAAVTDETGDGDLVTNANPTIYDIYLEDGINFNGTSYTYGTGSAALHRTALELTGLATTTPGTDVATALGVNVGTAGSFVLNGGALGTPSSGTLTSCTGLPISGLTASTTTALGVGSIELGHATDTTISRVSAGRIAVEGVNLVTTSSTDTLTNKTLTAPTINAITTTGSLLLSGTGTAGLFGLKSTSTTGYASMELIGIGGSQMGGFGYANASAGAYADQVYFYSTGKALIIATAAGSRHLFLSTTGDLSIGSGAAANTKSVLDLTSTTKGFLPPRMTTGQRDAITSVPAGLTIYNTSTNKLNFYNGSAWEAVTSA